MDSPTPVAHFDIPILMYLASASTLGLISALASILGNEERPLTWRAVSAYLIAGAVVSLGLTLFLAAKYGFSYFLLGVSIFAGYKAFDVLAVAGIAASVMIKKLFSRNEP